MNEGSAAFLLVRVGVADAGVAPLRVAAGHALHRLGFAAVVAFVVALPALPAFLAVPLLLLFHGASSCRDGCCAKSRANRTLAPSNQRQPGWRKRAPGPLELRPLSTDIGQPVRRTEDATLLSGKGRYTDDLNEPGQAYAGIVRSPYAHGVLKGINV